jgi:phosphatidylinositol-3-phosphatase
MTLGIVAAAILAAATAANAEPPRAAHVTVVVMENRAYGGIVGNPGAPYFNGRLRPQGALLENSHAVAHPSEPNYLALFSGSTQGLTGDTCPVTYASANLASNLARAGKTFALYAESLPTDGYRGCWSGSYARKHDPAADFTSVPASENRVYRGLPATVPDVMWIVPNVCHDMHDCSTAAGDAWLAENLPPLIAWNARHDGLLVLTWDEAEPDEDGTNRIPTLLVGPMVRPGARSAQRVDHYSVLRTIERIFSLECIARECGATPIEGVWR